MQVCSLVTDSMRASVAEQDHVGVFHFLFLVNCLAYMDK